MLGKRISRSGSTNLTTLIYSKINFTITSVLVCWWMSSINNFSMKILALGGNCCSRIVFSWSLQMKKGGKEISKLNNQFDSTYGTCIYMIVPLIHWQQIPNWWLKPQCLTMVRKVLMKICSFSMAYSWPCGS